MPIDIPIGKPHVELSAGPQDSDQQADAIVAAYQAKTSDADSCRKRLSALAASYPTSLNAWAGLGELALPDDVIAAYAFFRTGYHRGLDRARASGWNGSQKHNQGPSPITILLVDRTSVWTTVQRVFI